MGTACATKQPSIALNDLATPTAETVEEDGFADLVTTVEAEGLGASLSPGDETAELLTVSFGGHYQLELNEGWLVVDLNDPAFYSFALQGEEALADYLRDERLASLLSAIDIDAELERGLNIVAYRLSERNNQPATTMNIVIQPLAEGVTLEDAATAHYKEVLARVGSRNVLMRYSDELGGYELVYAMHLVERELDVGLDMIYLERDGTLLVITFIGEPTVILAGRQKIEEVALSVVDLQGE
ncbi:MAG: hypothetical protein DWQ07_17475 [Chloroflexi bacterium]|nr:MAG: hypothetical protein DWQ07_17475 [Chloroflexota bacterium]